MVAAFSCPCHNQHMEDHAALNAAKQVAEAVRQLRKTLPYVNPATDAHDVLTELWMAQRGLAEAYETAGALDELETSVSKPLREAAQSANDAGNALMVARAEAGKDERLHGHEARD